MSEDRVILEFHDCKRMETRGIDPVRVKMEKLEADIGIGMVFSTCQNSSNKTCMRPGGVLGFSRGGGGGIREGGRLSFQAFDPLPTQRVPLCATLRYPFLVTDPKILLKAASAPIYTNFEKGARAEKTRLFGKNFPKSA